MVDSEQGAASGYPIRTTPEGGLTPTGSTDIGRKQEAARPLWRLLLRGLVPLVGVALFVLALVVLHRELAAYGFREITSGIRALPARSLLIGLGLTMVSLVMLSASEALAVRWVDGRLGYPRVAFASFLGYAFNQVLGSPVLTGAPVRYRLYSAWDLSTDQIARIVAFGTATTVFGLLAVLGGALLLLPAGVPVGMPVPAWALRSAGLGAMAILFGFAAWTFTARASVRVFSWEVPLPSPRLAAGKIAAGAGDWLVGAGVLYALLPTGHGLSFLHFAAVFAVALSLGQVSLVPGGLGVFEAVLLLLLRGARPRRTAGGFARGVPGHRCRPRWTGWSTPRAGPTEPWSISATNNCSSAGAAGRSSCSRPKGAAGWPWAIPSAIRRTSTS